MPTIAFLNPPFWTTEPIPNTPGERYLRRGIRAGSRWPFTVCAPNPPGSAHAPIGHYLPYPAFLGSAAAWVNRAFPEAKVVLRDSIARYESVDEFNAWWVETAPDFVIIETGAAALDNDLKYIRAMKQSNPEVKIAVAGPPARDLSKRPEWQVVDAFLLGEYEKPSARFVAGERGVIGFELLTKAEMATLPFPMFDEEVAHHYADANPKLGSEPHPWPELTVWASRGCWAVCNFCSFPATMTNDDPLGKGGRKIRFYDPEWLESFILSRACRPLPSRPIKAVRFDGDTENASDRHTLAICEMMKRVGLPWSMMCRADTSSREVWQAMKDAGCFGVKIGFESGCDRIVNEVVKKRLNLKEAAETARFLRSIGMSVHGTLMIGHPSETDAERQQTLDFIQELYATNAINSHQLSATAELSGTPLANALVTDPNYISSPDGQKRVEGLLAK